MAKFKNGDIVEIIPGDRYCKDVQDQYGKKLIVDRVIKRHGNWFYTLKGFEQSGIPFICPEDSLRFREHQLVFPHWNNNNSI